MLSPNRLERLAANGEYDRLLADVLRNGRSIPLAARLRLCEALPAAALGLALQRLLELTRRPTGAVCALAADLLDQQSEDGGFGAVAATAVAVSALTNLSQIAAYVPGAVTPEFSERVGRAVEQGHHHLFAAQDRCFGVDPAGLIGDGLDSALVYWQLGHDPAFGRSVRMTDLQTALADPEITGDPDARAVLALAGAARPNRRSTAAAA